MLPARDVVEPPMDDPLRPPPAAARSAGPGREPSLGSRAPAGPAASVTGAPRRTPRSILGIFVAFVCLSGAVSACRDRAAPRRVGGLAPSAATAAPRGSAPDRQSPSSRPSGATAPAASPATPDAAAAPVHVDMPAPPPPPGARPDAAGPDANRAIFSEYGFPGAPDLVHLCGQRVYQAGGEHLTWDAFASDDAPDALVAHYKEWLGSRGLEAEDKGAIWRVPSGAPKPDRVLEILPAGAPGPYTACEAKPPASAKSVIMISRR